MAAGLTEKMLRDAWGEIKIQEAIDAIARPDDFNGLEGLIMINTKLKALQEKYDGVSS